MSRSRRLVLLSVEVGTTIAIFLAVWYYTDHTSNFAIPPLSESLSEFRHMWFFDQFRSDVVPTLTRLLLGYGIAVGLGIPLGLALGSSKLLRLLLQPTVAMLRAIPAVALIPPLIILLGIGNSMKLFLVVIVCVWPIALNTCDGVLQLDQTMRATAVSYRLSPLERLRFVILPGVSPRAFAGMRASLALALILVIAGEYLAGTDGVGSVVARAQQTYNMERMWSGLILLGILGYLLNLLFMLLQRRVLHWQQPGRSS